MRPLTAVANVIAVLLVAPAATQQGVLPPEHSVVATQGPLPDEANDEFVTVSKRRGPAPKPFNNEDRPTRSITVSAKRPVVVTGHDPQGLLARVA